MHEVRRDSDGELCGHVQQVDHHWHALTVFGGALGAHPSFDDAVSHVLADGLASLAERWLYRADPSDEWEQVCIVEARPASVHIAVGPYSMPGVPVVELSRDQVMTTDVLRRDR